MFPLQTLNWLTFIEILCVYSAPDSELLLLLLLCIRPWPLTSVWRTSFPTAVVWNCRKNREAESKTESSCVVRLWREVNALLWPRNYNREPESEPNAIRGRRTRSRLSWLSGSLNKGTAAYKPWIWGKPASNLRQLKTWRQQEVLML